MTRNFINFRNYDPLLRFQVAAEAGQLLRPLARLQTPDPGQDTPHSSQGRSPQRQGQRDADGEPVHVHGLHLASLQRSPRFAGELQAGESGG